MRGINGEQNRAMRRWLRETYNGACAYCQRQIGKRGTVDHYLPRALGGGNNRHNLRWCCIACNQAKADMHPSEWESWPHRPAPRQPTRAEVRQHLLQLASPLGRVRLVGPNVLLTGPPPAGPVEM